MEKHIHHEITVYLQRYLTSQSVIASVGDAARRQFRTVQNPLIRVMVRERATSRKTHPEVLAQMDATNKGNKRKMSENKVNVLSTKQKWRR